MRVKAVGGPALQPGGQGQPGQIGEIRCKLGGPHPCNLGCRRLRRLLGRARVLREGARCRGATPGVGQLQE